MPQTVAYRLTIRNASTVANPDGTADELVLTSIAAGTNPYIAAPPSGDGAEVDPLTGSVRTGAYVVEVVDADTGTDATGTLRVLTNKLEDATFRQQLLSRRAYVDVVRAGVSSRLVAGYISSVRLVSPMRYAITVGDTRRVERSQTIFQGATLGSYVTRGCITGGPVTPTDFGTVRARGGWRYRVAKSGDDVTLTFVDGYESGTGSPIVKDWRQVNRSEVADVLEGYRQPNPYALALGPGLPSTSQFVTSYTTPVFDFVAGDWVVGGGVQAVVGSSATNGAAVRALVCGYSEVPANEALGVSHVYLYWPSCPHSNGAIVHVSLTTVDVTEHCPLYIDAHPVDLVTAIWTNARVQYNAASAATIKTLIGDTVRLACRFPQAPNMDEFLQTAIYGPFGISERTNTNGEQELFATRIKTAVLPAVTINAASMRGSDEVVFDLDEQTAVSGIRLTQQVLSQKGFAPGTQTQNGTNTGSQTTGPLDGVVVSEVTQQAQYLDPNLAVFAGRVIEYRIPGMIHTAADFTPATADQLDAIAIGTFDRFGRGCQSAEVSVLATDGAAAAQIGDEVYFEAPHFPNRGYRIGESTVGARIMQVVRRTETHAGPVFRLLDSGLAAQPVSPPATITVAQNPNAASTTARFTITNAAAINSGGVLQVRVEWATGTVTPTGNGADFALYAAGQIPTGAVNLPPVTTPGVTVYVRARTEQAGRRPSAWTSWASVALANIPTVLSLTSSNLRQTAVTLSWTNASSTLPLTVFAFQGASAPANWAPYRVGTLPAGTTSTVVRNLTGPSIAWAVGVAYETAQAVGAVTSTTVTTNSTLDTPTRPAGLAIIPGVDDATLTQGISLALWSSDQTLDLQIERSTVSGSGFATIATVSGATTVYVDQLPRNNVTYFYRLAHVLGGFTTSGYTPEVSGTARGVPVNVTRPGAVAPVVQVQTSETATQGTVTLTITDPQNRVVQVRFRERTNAGAWGAWTIDTTVPYSYTGTLPASGFLDIEYEVTGFDAAGTAAQILAGGIESFDANTTPDMVSVVGTFTSAGALTLAISADSDTASVKYAISTVSQPTLATVQAQAAVNGRNLTATFAGPYASGTTVFVSVLGYTGTGGTGSESALFEYRFVRDGGITYTECLATMSSASATQITVTVTSAAPSGTPTVQLVAITGSATLASGAAIGTPVASGSTWTFNRGAALGQPGGAQFRAVLSGAQSDDDFIEIPEQGRDTTYLASRARVISTSNTSVTVRYAVLDKYTGLSSTLTYVATGVATVTPASPQTVTAAVGDSFTTPEIAGSFVDFTIARPAFQSGAGRVTFMASATGRVSDSDAVDVPAIEQDTLFSQCLAVMASSTATTITVTVTGTAPSGTPTVQLVAITGSATLASGAAIGTPVVSGSSWTFNRGAALGQPGGARFRAVLSGVQSDDDFIEIPEQGRDTTYLATRARVTSSTTTQVTIRVAVLDALAALSSTITYSTTGLTTVSPLSGQTVTTAVGSSFTTPETAGSFVDFTVDRPSAGQPTGQITFMAAATGRVSDSDIVAVPAQNTYGLSCVGTFTAAGALNLAFAADTSIGSFKFAVSTSSLPSLGTVQATSPITARNHVATLTGPYALGTTVYVSAVTYTGASGTGQESGIFQFQFTRSSSTPTVKNRNPGNAVCYPARVNDEYERSIGFYEPGPLTGTMAGKHYGQVIVPRGVTLRAVRCNCYALQPPSGGGPGDTISLNFYRQSDSGGTTFLGFTAQNLYAGWQTLGVTSLSEDTTDRSYFIYFEVTWNSAPPSSSDLRIAWIEAEYDKPNSDANI